MQTVPNSRDVTPADNSTLEIANAMLSCGTRRKDHDINGDCNACDVCLAGLCWNRGGVTWFEGSMYHTRCLLSSRQKAITDAMVVLASAEDEFARACAAAVVVGSRP